MIDPIDWLNWWRAGFAADIHESWQTLPWFELTQKDRARLYQDSPSTVRALCNIPSSKVPEPDARTLRFIDLSPVREKAMFRLLSSLCNNQYSHLSPSDQDWCERMIKGIRPDRFLPQGIDYREPAYLLSLVQNMFLSQTWSRLRLRFDETNIVDAEAYGLTFTAVSLNRARALFDAALWRMEKR